MLNGVVGGYPVVDVVVTLFDGSYHEVDSSEAAFKMAAIHAFKDGMKKASPILLEPIMSVEVIAPEKFMGDVTSMLLGKRAQIESTEQNQGLVKVHGKVPLAEMFGFTTELRSVTSGRGSSVMEPSHYAPVPESVVEKLGLSGDAPKDKNKR